MLVNSIQGQITKTEAAHKRMLAECQQNSMPLCVCVCVCVCVNFSLHLHEISHTVSAPLSFLKGQCGRTHNVSLLYLFLSICPSICLSLCSREREREKERERE